MGYLLRVSIAAKRKLVQLTVTLLTNSNLPGFAKGELYTGKLKQVCVPGLNCYSCPGALGACPLGALQTMLADPRYKMSFYVIGLLAAFGLVFGRAVCGWLCPFGLLQELLHTPVRLLKPLNNRLARIKPPPFLRYTKYAILVVFVIGLPLLAVDEFGFGLPYFCELICPAGTIEGALPLLLTNPYLAGLTGALFKLKVSIAILTVALALVCNRFFCKYLCPLGAIYGLFNRVSLIQLRFSPDKCQNCGNCVEVCPMRVGARRLKQSPECIRCGKCVEKCAGQALELGAGISQKYRLR
jgi:polyferredoxin